MTGDKTLSDKVCESYNDKYNNIAIIAPFLWVEDVREFVKQLKNWVEQLPLSRDCLNVYFRPENMIKEIDKRAGKNLI